MPRALRIAAYVSLAVVVVAAAVVGAFVYKVKHGFPRYETAVPAIDFPAEAPAVLLFSKTTAFRHEEAIAAAKAYYADWAGANGVFLYDTEAGGVFTPELLARFDLVIFNNATGPGLTDEQRAALVAYVEGGGGLLAIHGAGDDSRAWPWWIDNVVGATFSHHPMGELQFQSARVRRVAGADLPPGMPTDFEHVEEWYVFDGQPGAHGFETLYAIDGETIDPNGNFLWIGDKDCGMGAVHPVAWRRGVGAGRTAYTSLGHLPEAYGEAEVRALLEGLGAWAGGGF